MNADVALQNLLLARSALASCGVRPFIVDGTLLGAVREQGFIAHDRDVDVGVFRADMDRSTPTRIKQAMRAARFRHIRDFGALDRGYEMSFRRRGVKVDVFVYYDDADGRYHAAWKDGSPIRYRYWPFGLAPLVFHGSSFNAPDDPERFLRAKYGDDWRVPVIEWDWAWGPKNAGPWGQDA